MAAETFLADRGKIARHSITVGGGMATPSIVAISLDLRCRIDTDGLTSCS